MGTHGGVVTPIEIWKGRHIPRRHLHGIGYACDLQRSGGTDRIVCSFDADGSESRIAPPEVDAFIWHAIRAER